MMPCIRILPVLAVTLIGCGGSSSDPIITDDVPAPIETPSQAIASDPLTDSTWSFCSPSTDGSGGSTLFVISFNGGLFSNGFFVYDTESCDSPPTLSTPIFAAGPFTVVGESISPSGLGLLNIDYSVDVLLGETLPVDQQSMRFGSINIQGSTLLMSTGETIQSIGSFSEDQRFVELNFDAPFSLN